MNEPNIAAPNPADIFVWASGAICTRAVWDAGAKRYLSSKYRVVLVGTPEHARLAEHLARVVIC